MYILTLVVRVTYLSIKVRKGEDMIGCAMIRNEENCRTTIWVAIMNFIQQKLPNMSTRFKFFYINLSTNFPAILLKCSPMAAQQKGDISFVKELHEQAAKGWGALEEVTLVIPLLCILPYLLHNL